MRESVGRSPYTVQFLLALCDRGACVGARCFEPLCAHTWGGASIEGGTMRAQCEHNARALWARGGSRVWASMSLRCERWDGPLVALFVFPIALLQATPGSGHVAPLRLHRIAIASPGGPTASTAGVYCYVFIQEPEDSMATCLSARPPGHYSAAAAAASRASTSAEAQYWPVELLGRYW
ncbi:hypothetical protein PMIN01_04591 [Paraphaeosphaeria minitans]|uniref:Uncharacterized protein n=1 Tax=Paraphaeosphaeria minitans TaxID=565426 RepID=A0A9P6GJI5_9PLEO|nr:hypothetical protein PMIN01_04591 [Paraphaeosphaeria minitans]